MHFLSILTYVTVCFFACLFPALCLQRVQRSRTWHEIICNLNCLSGGVFAAAFFILYNHVRHDFDVLFGETTACAWHSVFALDTVIVFCGFLLTALVEKLADFVQHRLASATAPHQHADDEKVADNLSGSHHHHHQHAKSYVEEMSPLTTDGLRSVTPRDAGSCNGVHRKTVAAVEGGDRKNQDGFGSPTNSRPPGRNLPTLTVLPCSGTNSPLKWPVSTGDAASPTGILLPNNKVNGVRRCDSAPSFDTEGRKRSVGLHAAGSSSADMHNLDEQDPHNCGHTHHHHHQHHHVPEDLRGSGTKRFVVIIVSLSAHSLFEGMALGLQESESMFVKLFLTIILHEALMALAIGLSISQQHSLSTLRKTLFCLLFAVIVPAGQLIGILMQTASATGGGGDHYREHDDDYVGAGGHIGHAHGAAVLNATSLNAAASCHTHAEHGKPTMFGAVVQAIAAGTFLFVTFMEILSERLNCHEFSIVRIAFILAGFLVIPTVTMLHHTYGQFAY